MCIEIQISLEMSKISQQVRLLSRISKNMDRYEITKISFFYARVHEPNDRNKTVQVCHLHVHIFETAKCGLINLSTPTVQRYAVLQTLLKSDVTMYDLHA